MDKKNIYTVGYTLFQKGNTIDIGSMFEILKKHSIDFLIDVRSVPYSKQYPQCNSENLKVASKQFDITYMHMPEVGAKASPNHDVFSKASEIFFEDIFPISKSNRPEKTELHKNEEIVDFNKYRHDEYFLNGLKRIRNAYDKDFILCIMCSEKQPMDCHRYFLISKALDQYFGNWLEINHIIQNPNVGFCTISQKELNGQFHKLILSQKKFSNILLRNLDGTCPIDNYYGATLDEKILDFCDRYWNLIHGWKNINNITYNKEVDSYD